MKGISPFIPSVCATMFWGQQNLMFVGVLLYWILCVYIELELSGWCWTLLWKLLGYLQFLYLMLRSEESSKLLRLRMWKLMYEGSLICFDPHHTIQHHWGKKDRTSNVPWWSCFMILSRCDVDQMFAVLVQAPAILVAGGCPLFIMKHCDIYFGHLKRSSLAHKWFVRAKRCLVLLKVDSFLA